MSPRPPELEEKLQQNTDTITDNIINVLVEFETGKFKKRTITAKIVAKLAGCSEGAINLRKWATERIKRIKQNRKNENISTDKVEEQQPDKLDDLRERVSELLKQNVFLYEEILVLKETNEKLTIENKELAKNNSKLVKKQLVNENHKDNMNIIDLHSRKDK